MFHSSTYHLITAPNTVHNFVVFITVADCDIAERQYCCLFLKTIVSQRLNRSWRCGQGVYLWKRIHVFLCDKVYFAKVNTETVSNILYFLRTATDCLMVQLLPFRLLAGWQQPVFLGSTGAGGGVALLVYSRLDEYRVWWET